MRFDRILLIVVAALLACAPALADEWTVVRLRGGAQQLIDTVWTDLKRGDLVPDDRTIKTLADGRIDLQRDKEVVTLGADTQIQIHDKTDVRFTIVQQDFGTVEVEAEVENVQHFAVETKYLAAVVKGTHFVVTANDLGASVAVTRGAVAVESMSSHRKTTVTIGQMARVEPTSDVTVGGGGSMPAIYAPDGGMVRAAGSPAQFEVGNPSSSGTLAATGGPADDTQTTAMLASPANVAAIPQLRGSLGSAGSLATALTQGGASPAPIKDVPINLVTILIGMLVGIVIGALALFLRRSVG